MDLGHAAVCAAETGHVYMVAPTNNGDKAEVAGGGAAAGSVYLNIFILPLSISSSTKSRYFFRAARGHEGYVSDGDACDTFQLVAPPGDATWLHSVTACLKVCIYNIYAISIISTISIYIYPG